MEKTSQAITLTAMVILLVGLSVGCSNNTQSVADAAIAATPVAVEPPVVAVEPPVADILSNPIGNQIAAECEDTYSRWVNAISTAFEPVRKAGAAVTRYESTTKQSQEDLLQALETLKEQYHKLNGEVQPRDPSDSKLVTGTMDDVLRKRESRREFVKAFIALTETLPDQVLAWNSQLEAAGPTNEVSVGRYMNCANHLLDGIDTITAADSRVPQIYQDDDPNTSDIDYWIELTGNAIDRLAPELVYVPPAPPSTSRPKSKSGKDSSELEACIAKWNNMNKDLSAATKYTNTEIRDICVMTVGLSNG